MLTEGIEDAALIRAVITHRGLQPFDVSAVEDCGSVRGRSGFARAILGCEVISGFSNVQTVVLIADNNGDHIQAVADVCTQVREAKRLGAARKWGIPTSPATFARGDPSTALWMWPAPGEEGCLETLLWRVITAVRPGDAACAEAACRCSGAHTWPLSKLDKARVRCFISITHRTNPALPLALLWRDAPALIPVSHSAFDPLAGFLARL